MSASFLDRLNQQIADAITLSGFAFVMTSQIRGRTVLRLSICSHRTTLEDIDQVFGELRRIGLLLDQQESTPGASVQPVAV